MSDLLQWPAGTVRADMPSHPVAVGQKEGPRPMVNQPLGIRSVVCTSHPQSHTLVEANQEAFSFIRTYWCANCSRYCHVANSHLVNK